MTDRVIIRKATRNEPTELVVFNDGGEVCCVDVTGREVMLAQQLLDAHRTDHVEEAR